MEFLMIVLFFVGLAIAVDSSETKSDKQLAIGVCMMIAAAYFYITMKDSYQFIDDTLYYNNELYDGFYEGKFYYRGKYQDKGDYFLVKEIKKNKYDVQKLDGTFDQNKVKQKDYLLYQNGGLVTAVVEFTSSDIRATFENGVFKYQDGFYISNGLQYLGNELYSGIIFDQLNNCTHVFIKGQKTNKPVFYYFNSGQMQEPQIPGEEYITTDKLLFIQQKKYTGFLDQYRCEDRNILDMQILYKIGKSPFFSNGYTTSFYFEMSSNKALQLLYKEDVLYSGFFQSILYYKGLQVQKDQLLLLDTENMGTDEFGNIFTDIIEPSDLDDVNQLDNYKLYEGQSVFTGVLYQTQLDENDEKKQYILVFLEGKINKDLVIQTVENGVSKYQKVIQGQIKFSQIQKDTDSKKYVVYEGQKTFTGVLQTESQKQIFVIDGKVNDQYYLIYNVQTLSMTVINEPVTYTFDSTLFQSGSGYLMMFKQSKYTGKIKFKNIEATFEDGKLVNKTN